MTIDNLDRTPISFAPWIKRVAVTANQRHLPGISVVFPHAGAAAVNYRKLASALAAGSDTFIVQYPQRAERLRDPAPATVHELAQGLFGAGPWHRVMPLRLFGHSMGAVVAFEFARVAEARGVAVQKLWVSAGPVPSTVADLEFPTSDQEVLSDIAGLGGTDPRLLDDEEFAELLAIAARADYQALNRYRCAPDVRIRADIHAIGGRDDPRVGPELLRRWADHTAGRFTLSFFDGGHFYVNDHINTLANRVITDV